MARKRMLSPHFFTHERLTDLEPLARLLFAALWTMADREGRLEERLKTIKHAALPWDDVAIEPLLEQLASTDGLPSDEEPFIVRYEARGRRCIAIPNFGKWQRPHPKEPASTLPAPSERDDAPSPGAAEPDPVTADSDRAVTSHGEPRKETASRGESGSDQSFPSSPSVPSIPSSPSLTPNAADAAGGEEVGSAPIEPEIVAPAASRASRLYRVPDDFEFSNAVIAVASGLVPDTEVELQFRLYKSYEFQAPFSDPLERWRRWCLKFHIDARERGTRTGLAEASRQAARESARRAEREGDADIAQAIDERKRRRHEAEERASV